MNDSSTEELFPQLPPLSDSEPARIEALQGDLFLCDMATWSLKDDLATMTLPLFSLTKQKDIAMRVIRRGNQSVKIMPSAAGAATIYDKDLLLYAGSQIVAALNDKRPVNRTVQIDSSAFLIATSRSDGRGAYERILDMLMRLRGTTIETNIETGSVIQTEGFGFIESYRVISEKKRTEMAKDPKSGLMVPREVTRVLSFQVTLSEWLMNALLSFEVSTMDHGYFKLKPFERRLYEVARKHCYKQPYWKCGLKNIGQFISPDLPLFKLRNEVRQSIIGKNIPEYHIAYDPSSDQVVFYTRNSNKLAVELTKDANKLLWYQSLERHDNAAKRN